MKPNKMSTLLIAAVMSLSMHTSCTHVEDSLRDYPTKAPVGTAYYIDSQEGNDSNDGSSPERAWKTFDRIDGIHLSAGNQILLRKGSVWTGQLTATGSGTQSSPIVIGSYGQGDLPVINGGGKVDAAIKLKNQSNWIIEGIEVTNTAPERDLYRCGILVENNNGGTISNIVIRNNRVHDVTSSFGYTGIYHPHQFGGIAVTTTNVTPEDKFDNVLIEGNFVEKAGRTGIVVWDYIWGANAISSTNVLIRNNTVKEIDSDGILTFGCNGSRLESNLADGCGSYREEGGFNGSAAIWCTRGKDCVIQFNEARNTKALEGNDDGMGFDIDMQSTSCVVQYNYSHDNQGGFMLIIDAYKDAGTRSSGNIVRYNISQNDRKRIFMIAGGVTPNMQIYNNTIYIGEGLDTKIIDHAWDSAGDFDVSWSFRNNIIYNLGSGDYVIPGTTGQFAGNLYYGNHPASEPAEAGKLTVDPKFVNPGSGGSGIATLAGYKLQEDSPALNAGVQIASNGGRDFWDNPVSRRGQPTIGAYEPNGQTQQGGYLYDPLDNWSLLSSYSENLNLDTSNPQFFDGDASRVSRMDKEDGVLIYNLEGLKSASVSIYTFGGLSPDILKLYVSATGEQGSYTRVATASQALGEPVDAWQKHQVRVNEFLGEGLSWLKVAIQDRVSEAWASQVGEVEISDEPAEVTEPEDNAFTDPMNGVTNLLFSSGDNLIVAWSSQEDIDNFFKGDAGRIARSDGNEAMMVWQYASVADFKITAYLCGDPGTNTDFLKVYGAPQMSLEALVEIPVRFELVATRGDWREIVVTPAVEVAPGYDYFALQLPQSAVAPGGWELQIGEVTISDAVLVVDESRLTDPLNDMSKTAHAEGIQVPWSSEEDLVAFFDGDAGRICRASDAPTGLVVYQADAFREFAITAFFCGDPGEEPFLEVSGAAIFDLAQAQAIACDYTLLDTRGDWRKYKVTPRAQVSGFNYLAVQMPTLPQAEHWAVQITEITIEK